jgi:hypothetical protein
MPHDIAEKYSPPTRRYLLYDAEVSSYGVGRLIVIEEAGLVPIAGAWRVARDVLRQKRHLQLASQCQVFLVSLVFLIEFALVSFEGGNIVEKIPMLEPDHGQNRD